jgi:hypothetical protein
MFKNESSLIGFFRSIALKLSQSSLHTAHNKVLLLLIRSYTVRLPLQASDSDAAL